MFVKTGLERSWMIEGSLLSSELVTRKYVSPDDLSCTLSCGWKLKTIFSECTCHILKYLLSLHMVHMFWFKIFFFLVFMSFDSVFLVIDSSKTAKLYWVVLSFYFYANFYASFLILLVSIWLVLSLDFWASY